jgi:hypothetical protein
MAQAGPAPTASAAGPPAQVLPDWKDYTERLTAVGERLIGQAPDADDPQSRQEAWKALHSAIGSVFLQYVFSDPNYPEFVSIWNDGFNLLVPNPDTMYTWTRANGSGIYRIRGFRNTVRYVELSIQTGSLLDGSAATAANVDVDSLVRNADTSFELVLSAERPKGYTGDWFAIPPATTAFLVRSQSYDWLHERDAVLSIENLQSTNPRPRMTAEETAASLGLLPRYVEATQAFGYARLADLKAKGLYNRLSVHDYVAPGPAYVKMYLEGLYDIADDEALIVETDVPKTCRYWSFLVGDDQFGTIDWVNHQSSLNGHQARLDNDGKFRGVIAAHDPGVPNWLDTGGYRRGIIQGRWDKCDSHPMPTITKVKLSELRRYLPKETPLVSPDERRASLGERRMGAQFRRRW